MIDSIFSPWPNRLAKLLAIVVFPLIWVGGLVTTSDAGMAVPDWPNTYNYNMFAYPIRDWFLGPWDLFVEHGHRLLGSLSGVIAIALCIATFVCDRRSLARRWSVLILILVIAQGILGGQRVVRDERLLAMVHGCVGPAFFATVVAMVVFTSRWWIERLGSISDSRLWSAGGVQIVAATLVLISYCQLVLGASLRHVLDDADSTVYAFLMIAHVSTAVVLSVLAGGSWYLAESRNWSRAAVRGPARLLGALVVVQIGLGIMTYVLKFGWPSWLGGFGFAARYTVAEKTFWQLNWITLHVAIGSLILATATFHCARVCRAMGNVTAVRLDSLGPAGAVD